MPVRHPACLALALLASTTLLAACGSDGTGPPPPPPPGQLRLVADSGNLQAATPGQPLAEPVVIQARTAGGAAAGAGTIVRLRVASGGGSVTPAEATTDAQGRARFSVTLGTALGAQLLVASAVDADSAVIVARAMRITGITPDPLVDGGSATISGEGFSTVADSNRVVIGDATVGVIQATSTSLLVTTSACFAADTAVALRVGIGGATTVSRSVVARAGSLVNVARGRQVILRGLPSYCLPFAASTAAGGEEYLVGIQSTAATPVGAALDVRITSTTAPVTPATARMRAAPVPTALRDGLVAAAQDDRWARHRAAHDRWQARQLREAEPALAQYWAGRRAEPATAAARTRPPANVGDTVQVRVVNTAASGDLCASAAFSTIRAVVRRVGLRGEWLEDVENPAGGFSVAQYDSLSQLFDTGVYATNVRFFGEPTDLDGNARVRIVVTRRVNEGQPGVLGFVFSGDLLPTSGSASCPASNVGELYYARAPDPANATGRGAYPTATAFRDAPNLIAHEVTHIIQNSRRFVSPGGAGSMSRFQAEGQATSAEEIAGFAVTGWGPRTNLGRSTETGPPFSQPTAFPSILDNQRVDWFGDRFADLAVYWGAAGCAARDPVTQVCTSVVPRIAGAPEQCNWTEPGNAAPCGGGRSDRLIYGIPALFLRWIQDHLYPTSEETMQRAFTVGVGGGFQNFGALTSPRGVDIRDALAQFSAALFLDDDPILAGASVDPRLTMPTYNMHNIYGGILVTGRPAAYERQFAPFADGPVGLRTGSTAYYRLRSTGPRPTTAVRVGSATAQPLPADVQVWVVRLR